MQALSYLMKLLHLCVFVVALLSLPLALYADDYKDARRLLEAGKILPLETILGNLPNEENRRVLEVELEKKKGLWVYEIEAIDGQGVVREYVFDAGSGELLKEKLED